MKTTFTVLIALVATLGWGAAWTLEKRGGTEADYQTLEALAAHWFEAYSRGDAPAVADIYDPGARIMSEGDASFLGADFSSRLEKSFAAASTRFESELEEIEVSGELAYIVGLYAAKNTNKSTGDSKVYGGRFFILLHRTERGWKVWRDIDNFTPDADELIARLKKDPR